MYTTKASQVNIPFFTYFKEFFLYVSALKAKTIFLSNIDLLCFDECHDSVGRNQYVGIMQYLMCKTIDHIPPVHSSPIIIGLTAAIGKDSEN